MNMKSFLFSTEVYTVEKGGVWQEMTHKYIITYCGSFIALLDEIGKLNPPAAAHHLVCMVCNVLFVCSWLTKTPQPCHL